MYTPPYGLHDGCDLQERRDQGRVHDVHEVVCGYRPEGNVLPLRDEQTLYGYDETNEEHAEDDGDDVIMTSLTTDVLQCRRVSIGSGSNFYRLKNNNSCCSEDLQRPSCVTS